MKVQIHLPPMFRLQAGGREKVTVSGGTIADCLADLYRQYPGLEEGIMSGKGKIRPGISVFLNGENTYPDVMTRPVQDGDEVHIAQMVLGG